MFYQIDVTPKSKKNVEPIRKAEKNRRYSLLLAPFQPQTRIELEAAINTSAESYLDIKNTSDRSLHVNVTKRPPDDRYISLSSTEITIKPNDTEELCIKWHPLKHGSWRDVIQFIDNRRIKYDVVIVCTTIGAPSAGQKNKSKANTRKKASVPGTIKAVSSNQKNILHSSAQLKRTISSQTTISNIDMSTKRPKLSNNDMLIHNKENVFHYDECNEPFSINFKDGKSVFNQNHDIFKQSKPELSVPIPTSMYELRRETYVKQPKCFTNDIPDIPSNDDSILEENQEENFDDSLSPPKCKPDKCQSDFSMILDNFALKTIDIEENIIQTSSIQCAYHVPTIENETFEISPHKSSENSPFQPANGTYEISKSPSDMKEIEKQTMSKHFELLSSMTPIREDHLDNSHIRHLSASSPLSMEASAVGNWDASKRRSNSISKSSAMFSDPVTVKEVLEADLWVKPKSCFESNFQSANFHLETIMKNTSILNEKNCDKMNETQTFTTSEEKVSTVCIEISPPKKVRSSKSMNIRKISPRKNSKIVKDKYAHETGALKKKVNLNTSIKKSANMSIPGVRITRLSLAGLKKQKDEVKSFLQKPKETSVKLHDPNDYIMKLCNPDIFAASTVEDPFLTSTLYYDERWMYEQEIVFKKWLNILLSPPEHLSTDIDTACVDVGKVWQSCRMKEETILAETKEVVSARYHTNIRLNTLRKAACAMFRKKEVVHVLSRTAVCIEKGVLNVRSDRNLHKDIGLQKGVLELFLSYNPLWLRIGLETIYGETIPLHSNDDWVGLTRFLLNRFFSDPFLMKHHPHPHSRSQPTFITQISKFMLKKFLLLVYFLDYAKCNKLIGHDPCLFHKRAIHKESRSILLTFSREVLSGIGDITKVLRAYDYVVSHKQTYLDEYDYAVTNICTDLRDGVRLCRVMELITGKRDLTVQCRVPAISRLQKIHNVDIALKELLKCDFVLMGNIEAKNIADGHREKTLSLLWQIIYKYQAPRFNKAVKTLQRWWRAMLWYVRVKHLLKNRREYAACTIQRAWKCSLAMRQLACLKENHKIVMVQRQNAAQVIQTFWRRMKLRINERNQYLRTQSATIKLQRWWKRIMATKEDVQIFRKKRNAAILIQQWWRAEICMRKHRYTYIILRDTIIKIQRLWRAKTIRKQYLHLKSATILVQTKWRANASMRLERECFRQKLRSVRDIQSWWRGIIRMKQARNAYVITKDAAITIERWWLCILERKHFISTQRAIIVLQRAWRLRQAKRKELMQLQRRCDACRKIQSWWRSIIIAQQYNKLKTSCIIVQRWWRGLLHTRAHQKDFIVKRNAAITIQQYWRMRKIRQQYLRIKLAAFQIQTWYRGLLMTRLQQQHYTKVREAIINIQRWWRRVRLLRKERRNYLQLRKTTIMLQTRRRNILLSCLIRNNYLLKRKACIAVQAYWRMHMTKKRYHNVLKKREVSAITLQRFWRAKIIGRNTRVEYRKLKSCTIIIQRWWRNVRITRTMRKDYLRKKSAASLIQTHFRSFLIGRNERKKFCALKTVTMNVQRRFRANLAARRTRFWYLQLREIAIKLQRRYRAKKIGWEIRNNFVSYRKAAIIIQSYWRMHFINKRYLLIKTAIVTLQSHYRAYLLGRKVRADYIFLRQTAIKVQQRYRANKACLTHKMEYTTFRKNVIWIQRTWRRKQCTRLCMKEFSKQRSSALKIQRWWRHRKFLKDNPYIRSRLYWLNNEILHMSVLQKIYVRFSGAATIIQKWWREILHKRIEQRKITRSVQVIERWWLKVLQFRKDHKAAARIQALWRGHKVRKSQSTRMTEVRKRCREATKNAVSSNTLAYRYQDAINKFTCCDSIGQLSMSLMALDTITRLSPCACITLCELNLVDSVYGTLAQSNRSLPWMTVSATAASILLTLAKFSPTQKYVRKPEYARTIAKLLSASLEYKPLFLNLATLIWTLGEDEDYVREISSCHQTKWILTSLYNKIIRRKPKPAVNSEKQRENDYILPSNKPDWGLKQKRPRVFAEAHYAIVMIMKRFNS